MREETTDEGFGLYDEDRCEEVTESPGEGRE